MTRKNIFKIAMDLILVVLIAMLYQKQVISLEFHEIAGLVLFGLFVIHITINHRWITTVTKRLADRTLPVKTKIGYVLNLLLGISWVLIILSGVFISKTLFSFHISGPWKTVHYFASAVALILVGAHVGLHWGFIRAMIGKAFRWMGRAARPLGAACICALLLFGVYSVGTTDFTRWLTMPFSTSGEQGGHPGQSRDLQGMAPPDGEGGRAPQNGEAVAAGQPSGAKAQGHGRREAFRFTNLLNVVAGYLSIIAVFAALTCALEWLLKKKKRSGSLPAYDRQIALKATE